jgi:hypothetical protein
VQKMGGSRHDLGQWIRTSGLAYASLALHPTA